MPPHCDSLDGPVVRAAQASLDSGDPAAVLAFVPAAAETELRDAFAKTLQARSQGPEAQHVADRWFYETAVRLHRAGEGAPFMGLKPAGLDVGPVVPLAEAAVRSHDLKPLFKFLTDAMHRELHHRFERMERLRDHDSSDVAAARAYTSAMLGFILWAHSVHQGFGKPMHGEGGRPPAPDHEH